MAVDIAAIRTAIAERITEVCGINAYPFDVPSTVYPRAIVLPGSPLVEYHAAMRDLCRLNFVIEVRTNSTDPVPAQAELAAFCGAGTGQTASVFDALEDVAVDATTPTLDGAVENITVEQVEVLPGVQLVEGPLEFTANFRVAVKARRD